MSGGPAGTPAPLPASPGREVLVIMNIPTPYRVPLFNELDRQLSAAGYRLRVVFGAMGYEGREWSIPPDEMRFDFEVLQSRSFSFGKGETVTFTYPGLYRLLRREVGSPGTELEFAL